MRVLSVTSLMSCFTLQTDSSKEFQEIAKYTYDATNMRTRAIEEVQRGRERDYYDVLHLYNEVRM